MGHLQDVDEVPYPPAPWDFTGQMWTGLFRSTIPRPLPDELKHLLDPHLFIVGVVRYLDGTLRYDELLFGTLAWLGARPGIHIDNMWVNDQTSLWGGRKIWGLPKNLANFTWDGPTVQVSDEQGLIAKISVDLRPARLPWMLIKPPEFGRLDSFWVYFAASIWARLDNTRMQIVEWPGRYAALQNDKSILSFGAKPFKMKISSPKILETKRSI